MASVGNILLEKDILLESGTNELEVLVFEIAGYTFGINVAKVREVLPVGEITSLPKAHPSVRGVFRLRDHVIPCVSLIDHLGIAPSEDGERTMVLADFNFQQTAFLVDEVERIHRLSWEDILAVPPLMALAKTPVTAVARRDDRLIVMLDFEMIIDQVTDQALRVDMVENPHGVPREELKILLADDSPTVREAVSTTLRASGYTQLVIFENGAQAWQWIDRRFQETGDVTQVADLLVSDVEMPQIDGLHLTRQIKKHPELKKLPVLLYSSIITPDNFKKGVAVGADMQVSKPDLGKVVEIADKLILEARGGAAALRNVVPERGSKSAAEAASSGAADSSGAIATTAHASGAAGRSSKSPSSPPESKPAALRPATREEAKSAVAVKSSASRPATGRPVPPGLWGTFRDELRMRLATLAPLLEKAGNHGLDARDHRDTLRILHTIKSAASVIPLPQVTDTTHLAESIVEHTAADPARWPDEVMQRYARCLREITNSRADLEAMLSELASLVPELNDAIGEPCG